MILDVGDTVLVSHRRMYQHDEARFFVGQVVACDRELVKLEGYSFVRDLSTGQVIRKNEKRIKLLSIASPGYIFYQLMGDIEISAVNVRNETGELFLVEGERILMNLAERSHCGHI